MASAYQQYNIESYANKELKKRAVLSFQNIVPIAIWSLLMYSSCSEYNLSKEQTITNLSAMLLFKVYFYLNTDYYNVITL